MHVLSSARKLTLCSFLFVAILTLQGCGEEPSGEPVAVTTAAGQNSPALAAADETNVDEANVHEAGAPASRYEWYMESTTPAGRTEITRHGDGRISSDSFIHWNNREWTVKSELQLDEAGLPTRQRITGISPFQAPIDELFELADGQARWKTVGEQGESAVTGPGFYMPAEPGALESLDALVRAAVQTIDGEIALLPAGTARVEKISDLDLALGDAGSKVSLYAISGLGFKPSYVWLDQDLQLVALDFSGWLGMVPEGWGADALRQMSEVQTREAGRFSTQLTERLANRLERPLVFEQVDVVDVVSGKLLENRHVRVADGLIRDIAETPIEDADALRVDGRGKTLMPGMWDMHGHFSLQDGVLNIAGGITSVRDIGNEHAQIMEAVTRFDSGAVIGPHTYRAGFMDKAGPYASGWAAETLDDALQRVDFFAEHGYIQIKLYSSIEPAWVAPIAERAHAHGMRLSGHIPAFMSAEQAVRAGYDEIQHINMVFLNFIVGDQGDTRQQIRFTAYGDEALNVDPDSEEVEDFIALLKQNNVVVDPTAAIFETMLIHGPGEPDPAFAAVIDHLPITVRRPLYNPQMVLGENWPESAKRQAQMLRKLHESGVQLVPGSDNFAAFTLHRELEVYAEAGIPPADVLRIATLDSARVVGVADRTGSVEVGKASDLVLLDGNPLEDISAVRLAVLVMKGDTVYRPDQLYEASGVRAFVPSIEFTSAEAQVSGVGVN